MSAAGAPVLSAVRKMLARQMLQRLSDQELLERFVSAQDQAAFETVVLRHGPMVWRVCCRMLSNHHDAEDACQATFVVLAKKAGSIARPELLANWLHGIAYRTAVRAKADAARRQRHETSAAQTAVQPPADSSVRELCALLDHELHSLRDCYRAPLILCYLEGNTRDQAAKQLGLSLRTLERRLEHGRALLRARLVRRGVSLSAVMMLSDCVVPTSFGSTPIAATIRLMAGKALGTSNASMRALIWANGILHATALAKAKSATLMLVTITTVLLAGGVVAQQVGALNWLEAPDPGQASQEQPLQMPAPKREGHVDLHGDPLPVDALVRLGTVRWRHAKDVKCAVFTPDGKGIITGSADGTVRLWEIATGKESRRFYGPEDMVRQIALSTDGTRLAIAQGDGGSWLPAVIFIWDVISGKQLAQWKGLKSMPVDLAWAGNNNTLAVSCSDGKLCLFDVATANQIKELSWHAKSKILSPTNLQHTIAFAADGATLASCDGEGAIRLGSALEGDKPRQLSGKEKSFYFVAFSADGKTLISGGDTDGTTRGNSPLVKDRKWPNLNVVAVWDPATGQRLRDFEVGGRVNPNRPNKTLSKRIAVNNSNLANVSSTTAWTVSHDAKILAVAHWDNVIHLWDINTGKPLRQLSGYAGRYEAAEKLTFSPDNKILAVCGGTNAVCLLDVATGKELFQEPASHELPIADLAWSPDGKRLATAGLDDALLVWDAETGRRLNELRAPPILLAGGLTHAGWCFGLRSVAFSPDGRAIAAGNWDGAIHVWNATTGKPLWQKAWLGYQNIRQPITTVAFAPNGKALAAGAQGLEFIKVCNTGTGTVSKEIASYFDNGEVFRSTFSLSGLHLSTYTTLFLVLNTFDAEGNLRARRVDIADPQVNAAFIKSRREILTAVSADGQLAAVTAADGPLVVWELESKRAVLKIDKAAGQPKRLAFSPNGLYLALCASEDYHASPSGSKAVEILEIATGKVVSKYQLPATTNVVSVGFSPNGRRLATGLSDTTILIWDVNLPLRAQAAGTLEDHWTTLAGDDAAFAWRTIATMQDTPTATVQFLKKRLQPKEVDRKLLMQLIADLDSDQFAVRDAATQKLKQFGPEVAVIYSEVLAGNPSLELRRRLEALQANIKETMRTSDVLRGVRAVAVLESIGTPDARQLLELLAKGAPGSRITQEAGAAVLRMRG
jgi:RNA polymerase sigma factor (sigma-70 family)